MEVIFWVSVGIIVYVYAGYPLILRGLTLVLHPPWKSDDDYEPMVSLVIAAHNEECVLREKLDNSLTLDYTKDRLEVVVASDGSADGTNNIARAYAGRGVVLHEIVPRGGKTRALNLVIPKTCGEILILSDANTMYRADAIRKLVRHFVDPSVGAVSGDVRLVNAAETHAGSEGLYYRYERWLQSLESSIGSIIGADGAMYAIRRECYRAPSNSIVLDDFVISMTVARLGYRVLYDSQAVAFEQGTRSSGEEFRRKVRIVAGGVQALAMGEGLPKIRQPVLMFKYLSHKFLRWLVPCFLLFSFVSSVFLLNKSVYFKNNRQPAFTCSIQRCRIVGIVPIVDKVWLELIDSP